MLQRLSPHDPWSAGHHTMAKDEAAEHERMRRFRDAALPHLDDVFTLARYLVRDPSDAEDAAQECYERALRHFDSYRGPAMKPWLLAILRNVCNDTFARRRSEEVVTDYSQDETAMQKTPLWQEAQASPEGLILRAQDNAAIRRLIAELPEPFREAIVLREINDLSYQEIADVSGVPVGTVMSRLARARTMLRTAWNAAESAVAVPPTTDAKLRPKLSS
jgi:RNA polymerase sigma-70 factor, ECF subfamily